MSNVEIRMEGVVLLSTFVIRASSLFGDLAFVILHSPMNGPLSHRVVRVSAPSRLHFGLLAAGEYVARRFGGIGVMVERPATEVTVAETGHGQSHARADEF